MLFSQLKIGDHVHVLEVLGTFKKTTVYSLGSITQVSNPYDVADIRKMIEDAKKMFMGGFPKPPMPPMPNVPAPMK